MRLIVIMLLGLLCAVPAAAQTTATLTCDPPTERADGEPLTDFAGVRFYRAQKPDGPWTLAGESEGCEFTDGDLAPSTTYYWVAAAFTTADIESAFSNIVSKTTAGPEPSALRVSPGDRWVYELLLSRDRIAANIVGRAPEGTLCDESQPVLGFHVIPYAAVEWLGSARAEVVVARCSIF